MYTHGGEQQRSFVFARIFWRDERINGGGNMQQLEQRFGADPQPHDECARRACTRIVVAADPLTKRDLR